MDKLVKWILLLSCFCLVLGIYILMRGIPFIAVTDDTFLMSMISGAVLCLLSLASAGFAMLYKMNVIGH
jgi:hypothetical protein